MSRVDENKCCEPVDITKIINSYLDGRRFLIVPPGFPSNGLEDSLEGRKLYIAKHFLVYESEENDDKKLFYGVSREALDWGFRTRKNGSSNLPYEELFNYVAGTKLFPLMRQLGYSLALHKITQFHSHYPQLEIGMVLTQPFR